MSRSTNPLPPGDLLELKRWNTPTIYNGWEQITRHSAAADAFNREGARFMDGNECQTLIAAARGAAGRSWRRICADLDWAAERFGTNTRAKFSRRGEW